MTKETSSPIHHLAVYGTLRDDDNSGAAWTEAFVKDIKSAITGKVRGAKMYWNTDLKYPFVTLTGIHTDSITVRVLEWFSDEQFQNKIIEADRIEGYFPDQPDFDSEYVRKVVQVHIDENSESIPAYIYVTRKIHPEANWKFISNGDWLKR